MFDADDLIVCFNTPPPHNHTQMKLLICWMMLVTSKPRPRFVSPVLEAIFQNIIKCTCVALLKNKNKRGKKSLSKLKLDRLRVSSTGIRIWSCPNVPLDFKYIVIYREDLMICKHEHKECC